MSLIQVTLVVPALLTLAMGHRTRKISCSTVIVVACYWLVTGIETADLIAIDIVATATTSLHTIVSSAAVIAIASILSCSYAVVTLCSFISPTDNSTTSARRHLPTFDALYRTIVGTAGILFAEIPLVAVRSQVIAASDKSTTFHVLPVVFCMWLIKDSVFILIAVVVVVLFMIKARRKIEGTSCDSCGRMAFDNPDVFFAPEKRDTYIAQQHRLAAPGTHHHRDHIAESSSLMDETRTKSSCSDAPAVGGKRSKKSVTFRLDLNRGSTSATQSEDVGQDTDDDDD